MSEKVALIIATSQYQDAALRELIAPAQDAESLARVLSNPAIGGFQVRTLVNEASHRVSLEIESFCDNRKRDDLLLLYFSGHGIKDADGQLYFATVDTQLVRQNVRRATAVGASFVNQVMNRSRSRRQVILLDCCYSGAFKEGMLAKAGKCVGIGEQFEGQGRVVLTASDALQYSFEGEQVQGEGVRSIFTHIFVHGLETGEADLDRDGFYSLDEVYDYLYARVSDEQPEQKPMKMGYVEGRIFIGNNPRPRPANLPPELQESLEDRRPWVRLGGVQELEKLLGTPSKGLALAAQDALSALATGDDSFEVRAAASKCLAARAETPAARSQQSTGTRIPATNARSPEDETSSAREEFKAEPLAAKRESVDGEREAAEQAEPVKAESVAEQGRREKEQEQTVERSAHASVLRFSSRFPAWLKAVTSVLFGALIVAAASYWTLSPWLSNPLRSWKSESSGTSEDLTSVHFADASHGWAVGYGGVILATSDGGLTWKPQTSRTSQDLMSVYFADARQGWAVGDKGTILNTSDGGLTWKRQTSRISNWLSSVYLIDASRGWAVGWEGVILATSNGGLTWKPQTSGTGSILSSVYFADATRGWAVGEYGTILNTSDGGLTWRPQTSPTSNWLSSVYFIDASRGWTAGEHGTILNTSDGGLTWKPQDSGTKAYLPSVYFTDVRRGWAVGTSGTILTTSNGGLTWKSQTSGISGPLNSVYFTDARQGWAVGQSGAVLRWY